MSEHDNATIERHQDHFEKIFKILDDFRDNYVKAPTFVATLVSTVIAVVALSGWIFSIAFANIDKNEKSVVDMAIKQGRILERQDSLEREQEKTITQLIDALRKHRVN